jgi:hypothetical protein
MKKNIKERFLSKINKTDGCWLWKASFRGKYGCFKVNNKLESAHRVSYQLFIGEIKEGMFICHHCDNPKCVNPAHLFLGSRSDNMKDAWLKNRIKLPDNKDYQFKSGEKHRNSKLKYTQVAKIRSLQGVAGSRAVSKQFGVSPRLIKKIWDMEIWL